MDARLAAVVLNGEFRNGFIVFGLFHQGPIDEPAFPHPLWPSLDGLSRFRLYGENWQVFEWDIAIDRPPRGNRWLAAVRGTLQAQLNGGAIVAWIGSEGWFCDPPLLFDPTCMSGGVLAYLTPDGTFDCRIEPGEQLAALSDQEMLALRSRTEGLAELD